VGVIIEPADVIACCDPLGQRNLSETPISRLGLGNTANVHALVKAPSFE
jgi:hypothetical protein